MRDPRMRCIHDLLPCACGWCEWHVADIPADSVGRVVPPDRARVRPPDVRGSVTARMHARGRALLAKWERGARLAARRVKVAARRVERAERLREVDPELAERVRAGQVSLCAAERELRARRRAERARRREVIDATDYTRDPVNWPENIR